MPQPSLHRSALCLAPNDRGLHKTIWHSMDISTSQCLYAEPYKLIRPGKKWQSSLVVWRQALWLDRARRCCRRRGEDSNRRRKSPQFEGILVLHRKSYAYFSGARQHAEHEPQLTLTSFICQPKLLQLPEARDRFLRGEKLFIGGRLYALGWRQVAKQKIVAKRRDVAALYANREVAWLGRAIIVDRRRATDGLPTSRAP